MANLERSVSQFVDEKREELEKLYPIEASYGSRASLWGEGLKNGLVTQAEYNLAQRYYGKLWNYVGD